MDETELSFWDFSRDLVIPRLLEGFSLTLQLLFWCATLGLALGLVVALMRMGRNPFVRNAAALYIMLIRGTPLLLQILFVYFALPPLLDIRLDAMPAGVLALSLNAAAYFAEIFRAGIESVDKGQMEAARSVGMSHYLAMRRVILPQAFRRVIPPVVNELAALAKDTSLVSVVALGEVLFVAQRLGAKYLRPWEVYLWAAVGYLLIVVGLTIAASKLEAKLARQG